MPHVRLRVASALAAAALAVVLVPSAAQAGPRSPDPEVARAAVSGAPTTARVAAVAPSSIDSDVYAYVSTPSFRVYFVVAGHLKLQLRSGSTTAYQGTFVDYVGNRSTKASADLSGSTPKLKLEGKNGKFTFAVDSGFGGSFWSGTGTSVPSKLKTPAPQISLGAASHLTRSASWAITLSERSGAINNPLEYGGTLTMAYDANGRISGGQITVADAKGKNVTHGLSSSGYYSGSYFYTVAKVDKKYFGLSGTITGTSLSGYGFLADGSKTGQWVLSGTS